MAPGQPDYVVINNSLGELSEEQYLSQSRGGMGANVSAFTGVVKASAGAFSASTIVDADISASAGIDATKIANGSVTSTEFQYLGGVTSDIQTQINNITGAGITSLTGDVTATGPGAAAATIANSAVTDAKVASGIDAAKLADGSVSNTEYQYLGGVTSDIQTQLNARATTTDLSNHINDTTTHGTTGNIVGDSDTQTLTNKTAVTLLLDDAADFEQITTPSNPAAGRSKIYPKTDGFFYTLDSSGTEVQIGSGGSGTGTLNIVDNPSAISNTTGWTAATNYTVTRNTTDSPLEGVIDTCFAISTTTASSETNATQGVYAGSLAMPVALRNTKTQVSLYLTTPATADGVWRVSIWNASGTRMSLSSDSSGATTLPGGYNGQFVCTFDADSSATYSITLVQTTRTNANTLYVTNISIGNGITAQGAAVSGPEASVPTFTNFGTVSTTNITLERIGSKGRWSGNFVLGTTAGSAASLTLPNGYTASTAGASTQIVGQWWVGTNTASRVKRGTLWAVNGSGVITFSYDDYTTAASPVVAANGTSVGSSGESVYIDFSVGISQWAGSGTVNLGQGAQVEYSSDDGSADVFGPNGSLVPNVSFSAGSTNRTFSFAYAQQAIQDVSLEINYRGFGWAKAADIFPFSSGNNSNVNNFYGVTGYWSSSSVYTVSFGNRGVAVSASNVDNGAVAWSTEFSSGTRFRVAKANPSAPVGFGLASAANGAGLYLAGSAPGLTTGVAIANGYIGEMPGTLASGTGGGSYKTSTTTNWTNSAASIVSYSLNKGVYLVAAAGKFTGPVGAGNAQWNLRVGGTAVTSTYQSQYNSSGEFAYHVPMVPIVISSDSTAVALYGLAGGTTSNTVNDLFIVRCA